MTTSFPHVAVRMGTNSMNVVDVQCLASPWGPLILVASEGMLVRSSFVEQKTCDEAFALLEDSYRADGVHVRRGGPWVVPFLDPLRAYFIEPRSLRDLSLAAAHGAFQQRCIERLRASSPGQLFTYGGLARRVESGGGARAVASCLRTSAFDVVVPSHRVVTAKREILGPPLVVRWKADLLVHEGIALHPTSSGSLRVEPHAVLDED